ncbi:LysR family transcriptional regulator [Acidovorax sp. NCPPB 4044]|uniref:LysR family transcriptional regulator n=1 Tax=Acidovorax sp. NCPPB 4044 TaxID=2940490 RepID=UPI0023029DB9|nr:LysR family transcriptional regulator [Acidovorax sp. NCPPB 4044]MDA8520186.1 LysR family transcriptional regulator [Acidovorax sp. NCPPB 4044]
MIELRHLRYFIAVAEELNFRRAAERVHIDQTPLSRTIRDLEERWGVKLFVRTPRTLQLTPAGIKLLDHAKKLLVRVERTKRAVRATDVRYREPLRIGVDESTVQPALAGCLSRWKKVAPDTSFEIMEMTATEMLAALRSETIDIGFSFGAPQDDAVVQQAAWSTLLVAIVSPEHELAGQQVVSLDDLLSFPTITCTEIHQSGLFHQMGEILRRRNLSPTIAGQARSLTGYLTRVAVGQGVGVADADHMRALRRSDITVVQLSEQTYITTYILHKRRQDGLPDALQRFVTHATTVC